MKTFEEIAGEFLHEVELDQSEHLGPGEATVPTSPEQISKLTERLSLAARDCRQIVWINVAICALIVITGLVLTLVYRDNPKIVALLFGGSSSSTIILAVTFMRTAWREKYQMDMISGILPNLPPSDAAALIERIYFNRNASESTPTDLRRTRKTSPKRATGSPK